MKPKIALVEAPAVRIVDGSGKDHHMVRTKEATGKHFLGASLLAGGFEVEIMDMRRPNVEWGYEQVEWAGRTMTSLAKGLKLTDLEPKAFDVWGLTCNYQIQQTLVCELVKYISPHRPVVVGGVDASLQPEPYLAAGATLVVHTRDGAANLAAVDFVLGRQPRVPLNGVILKDGTSLKQTSFLHPELWPLSPIELIKSTLGYEYWEGEYNVWPLSHLNIYPQATWLGDYGCDRGCDFCGTPLFWKNAKLGAGGRRELSNIYKYMSPERVLAWVRLLKEAGAKSIISLSDQFLGRVLFGEEGRKEAMAICQGFRDLGLSFYWPNGSNELQKMTRGHGLSKDTTPDEELIHALYDWNGVKGCFHAYIPAERPVEGKEAYAKLLPLNTHKEVVRQIVRAGTPSLTYGCIIGLKDDGAKEMQALYDYVLWFKEELKSINPKLIFWLAPFCIRPIPGTGQYLTLEKHRLLHPHPTMRGAYGTPMPTMHLRAEEIAEWQQRFLELSDEPKWQW